MVPRQARMMVNLNPNAYLPSHKQGIVSKCAWGFPGGKRQGPLFGLRKDLSCAVPRVRSLLVSVTHSASAAWDVSLGQCVLHAPAVTIVQAWGQCADNMPAFQHKVGGFSLVRHFFPAAKFLQANGFLMDTPQLVCSVNTGPRTVHYVLSAVVEVEKDYDETFVCLFFPCLLMKQFLIRFLQIEPTGSSRVCVHLAEEKEERKYCKGNRLL